MRLNYLTDWRSRGESRQTVTPSGSRFVNSQAYAAFGQVSNAVTAGAAALVLSATLILISTVSVGAQQNQSQQPGDLTNLSLDQLMDIEVTSVSKKEEKLFRSAAAVYVITQEEIRRSGLTSIPELLRLVPGMQVARIDGNKWAISARGFNGRFANKLLVLIDGRSVYSPETSGVYWDVQDLILENIERIEVIRGPGATLWGTNAVNGVVNIITKQAKDTQGGLVTAGFGSEERGFGSAQYGGRISDRAYYRVYAKYFNRGGLVDESGRDANDGQRALRAGGRLDWKLSERDAITMSADIYDSCLRETSNLVSPAAPFAPLTNTPGELNGGNVLASWSHVFSERSDMMLKFYVDRSRRYITDFGDRIDTFDFDLQHHFILGRRQDIVWGFGHRLVATQTSTSSGSPIQFDPKGLHDRFYSAFVQDQLTLVNNRLRLTLGTKVEHNPDSGFEAQPSVRLMWTPSNQQSVWVALSRAIRAPSISNQDIRINLAASLGGDGTSNILALLGSIATRSEELDAYEIGYRAQPNRKLSLDIATFYNFYDRLSTLEPGRPFFETDPQPSHIVIPLFFSNLMRGETYGAETSVNWNVTKVWRLSGSYSFLRMQLHPYPTSRDAMAKDREIDNPGHQFQIHSYLNLAHNFELDADLYRVSASEVPAYTRIDARLGWRVKERVEVSLGLQNLLAPGHPEFDGTDAVVVASQVKPSVYGKLTWRF
jgi:iron complex outermembrane receptor protein